MNWWSFCSVCRLLFLPIVCVDGFSFCGAIYISTLWSAVVDLGRNAHPSLYLPLREINGKYIYLSIVFFSCSSQNSNARVFPFSKIFLMLLVLNFNRSFLFISPFFLQMMPLVWLFWLLDWRRAWRYLWLCGSLFSPKVWSLPKYALFWLLLVLHLSLATYPIFFMISVLRLEESFAR